MQCKNIPDRPILEFLANRNGEWAHWFERSYPASVRNAMPDDVPDGVVLAKMRRLIKRGLVDGCDCGCRGDFVITDAGRAWLER